MSTSAGNIPPSLIESFKILLLQKKSSIIFICKTLTFIFADFIYSSPSVLDRLNALLEPNGVLSINERGVIDGQIPTVTPHENFRYTH